MRLALVLAVLALGIASCVPDYGLGVADYRTVVTLRDSSTDFTTYRTYFLRDSVFHILMDGDDDDITRKYDQRLIDGVAGNLAAYGWIRVYDSTQGLPDAVVKISVTRNITSGYYWDYWYGGWYPWYGWGWGWYYPYYPPGSWNTYSYSTGSLIVEMDKIKRRATSDTLDLQPIWIGSSNGLLSGGEQTDVQLISQGARQMFTQSPYLNVGGE
jgi:hypothetical protein